MSQFIADLGKTVSDVMSTRLWHFYPSPPPIFFGVWWGGAKVLLTAGL